MKYRLINNKLNNETLVDLIFRNRKVSKDILMVNESNIEDFNKYDNIEAGAKLLISTLKENKKIVIVVDCDVDGYCSAAALYRYIKDIFPMPNIEYVLHTGKKHGLSKDIKIPKDTNLIILPDSSSSDYEEHKYYKDLGMDILVLDHHEAEKVSENAIVVNNQLSKDINNKALCGAGVVYKFCKMLDKLLGVNLADKYIDLVAIANIGDMMDLSSLETRYLVKQGLVNINNRFILELIKKQSFSMKNKVNIHNVAFYIVPPLNATIRIGKQSEKVDMFKALLEEDFTVEYKPRGKDKEPIQQHITEAMARICVNVKSRQDNAVKKAMVLIEEKIIQEKLFENKVLVVNTDDVLKDGNLNGLIANKLKELYKRPTLILRNFEEKNVIGGSARGYEQIQEDGAFKNICSESGLFQLAEGHANAFGIEIEEKNIPKVIEYFNEKFKHINIDENIHQVDYIFNADDLKESDILEIADMENEYGSVFKEPVFAVKGIVINSKDINLIGSKGTTLKFQCNNIDFIKFNCRQEFFEGITMYEKEGFGNNKKDLMIDLVCKFKQGLMGKTIKGHVDIIDYNVRECNGAIITPVVLPRVVEPLVVKPSSLPLYF